MTHPLRMAATALALGVGFAPPPAAYRNRLAQTPARVDASEAKKKRQRALQRLARRAERRSRK